MYGVDKGTRDHKRLLFAPVNCRRTILEKVLEDRGEASPGSRGESLGSP